MDRQELESQKESVMLDIEYHKKRMGHHQKEISKLVEKVRGLCPGIIVNEYIKPMKDSAPALKRKNGVR